MAMTRTKHPCAGLSQAAKSAFERVAVGQSPLASPATIQRLLDRGLIELVGNRPLGRDAFGKVTIPIYGVPLSVYYQWCQWCYENVPDDENQ